VSTALQDQFWKRMIRVRAACYFGKWDAFSRDAVVGNLLDYARNDLQQPLTAKRYAFIATVTQLRMTERRRFRLHCLARWKAQRRTV
jgi:hypothetical protein